jgi:hypothetical protein
MKKVLVLTAIAVALAASLALTSGPEVALFAQPDQVIVADCTGANC